MNQCRLQKAFTRDVVNVCDIAVPATPPKPVRTRKVTSRVRESAQDEIIIVPLAEQWPDTAPQWVEDVMSVAEGLETIPDARTELVEVLSENMDLSFIPPLELAELSTVEEVTPNVVITSDPILEGPEGLDIPELSMDFAPNNYYQQQLLNSPVATRTASTRVRKPIDRLGV